MEQAELLQVAGPGRDHGQDLGQLQPGHATLEGEEPQLVDQEADGVGAAVLQQGTLLHPGDVLQGQGAHAVVPDDRPEVNTLVFLKIRFSSLP